MTKFSKLFIALFLLSALLQESVTAQELSVNSDGRDFWVGFMYPSYNKVAAPATLGFYGAYLLISSYVDNTVSVFFYNRQTGVEQIGSTYFVSARTAVKVPMPLTFVMMGDSGDVPEYAACHVSALRPINVEFFSTGACAGGSFLALQTAALGKKYVIASYGDNNGSGGLVGKGPYGPKSLEVSHGFFEIVAPFDGTTVKITPNSTTMGGHPGYHSGAGHTFPNKSSYTVTLSRGQCYLVKSAGSDSTDDISGSIVESNLPVAVIAGHENAFIGGLSGRVMEGRNFMVQQMIPVELWDTTGYLMIPLKDSQPANALVYQGVGEDYRTFSDSSAKINLTLGSISGPIDMSSDELKQPATQDTAITEPVDFESSNGKKFSVIMYDRRNIANGAPFPAPSMITVVPIKNWKTSYLWYVPSNKFDTLQAYYCDIIAPIADWIAVQNGVVGSFNGGSIKPIKQILSQEQQWKGTIPNHPELSGIRFKLYPGCYYAHGPDPFIVYNFGFRGIDPNFDIGDSDYDDCFFSYGSPAGMRTGGIPHISVAVDTFCTYWNICVHDSSFGLPGAGIRSITLMDDPDGNEYDLHPNRPVVYYNTRLEDSLGTDYFGEIMLNGNNANVCFKVLINKPVDTGYAPLFISDNYGGATMIELHYTPQVKLTPDSGRFNNVMLQKSTCSTFVFKNTAKIIPNDPKSYPFKVNSAALALNNPTFQITSILPQLPTTLYPGDSIIITACFTPQDTTTQIDTILLKAGCFINPIDLKGTGAIPQIWASNHDFGTVIVDSTKCDTVGVYNVGKLPFTLTTSWVLDNMGVNFTFDNIGSTTIPKSYGSNDLPIVIQPGKKILLQCCYTPHAEENDSTILHWGTTLQDPYKSSIKDSSILYGSGVKTGFVWDRTLQPMQIDTSQKIDSEIIRVWLYNNATAGSGSPPAHVTDVHIAGTDASDFKMVGNQHGFTPMGNFNLNPGDSVWVDVMFRPDLTKSYSIRYADLVASDPSETGTILAKNDVKAIPQSLLFSIRPNPASGNSVIISFPLQITNGSITIFDVLGREVYFTAIPQASSQTYIPLGNISSGLYYIRLQSGNIANTQKLEVLK